MLHVTDRRSCVAFTVLVFLALIHSCRGRSEVIGPSQPIVATVGDDVVLPCRLEPVLNAADMTVEWARPDLDPRFVLVWRDGKELESKKHPSYRGRTSLSTEGLKLGDVSLKLSTVDISDAGTYRCFFPELDQAPAVQLLVGAVSSPVIQTSQSGGGGGGVLLQCESEGWYPEPEVLWLDGEGDVLSAGPTETLRRPDDLYNVSSRLTVDQRPSSNFTCRVQQKSINQTRETHVHVPDHFFMVPRTPSTPRTPDAPSTLGVIIGSVIAALLFIAAVLFIVWKWGQKRQDRPDQTDEEKTVSSKSDNTGSQVVMEGKGEREPLMAGREEENNVDDRGEEGERKDETHHGELVTEPDVDGAEGGRGIKSIKQDVVGRQVKNDGDEGGGEQTVKETEDERQEEIKRDGEKMELKTQEGDGSKDQEGNQRDFTRKVQINEESKETEREKKPPSAGREETRKRPGLKRHQETAGREHQELQQEESEPERCTMGKGRHEDGTDEGPDVDENQQKSEEMRGRGQQEEDVIEEVRQQPEESSQRLTDGGVKSQEVEQEEPMEVNTRPRLKAKKRGVRRQKQEQKVPVGERKMKRKDQEEGSDTEDFREAKLYVMSQEDQEEEEMEV